jgi:hypothetical protein
MAMTQIMEIWIGPARHVHTWTLPTCGGPKRVDIDSLSVLEHTVWHDLTQHVLRVLYMERRRSLFMERSILLRVEALYIDEPPATTLSLATRTRMFHQTYF